MAGCERVVEARRIEFRSFRSDLDAHTLRFFSYIIIRFRGNPQMARHGDFVTPLASRACLNVCNFNYLHLFDALNSN